MLSGRRGGKTLAGSIAAVREVSIPGTVTWACAPTNPKLHRYVIPAFQKLIPQDWVRSWSSEFNDLWLKNGSLLHFQTLEDPDQGRGQGLDCLWIDEVCELTEDHWHVIRPSLTEKRGVAFFTSSPRSYDWVYDNFYKRAEDGTPGYWATRYATSENPIISSDELAEARATMPDAMFRQEYEADFVVFTGSVYDALNDSHLLRTKEQIQQVIPEWPDIAGWRQTLVGIDTGADHPFGAVKLVSCEKGLVVVGEYLERHRSFIQHATEIKRLAGAANTKYAINRNERQPIIELAQHGIFCQSAENDQIAGIERVKSWLHAKQLFFVVDRCPRTVKQMKAYRWAPDKQKDGQVRKEKVFKKDDELPDCFIAGTLVETNEGPRSIEEIKTGDLVLTRKGFHPVTYTGSRIVPTYRLLLSDGTMLKGTATHPIWTKDKGFIPLTSLRYGDMLWPCIQTITALGLDSYGKKHSEQYRQSTISIIKTETKQTIVSQTLNAFLRRNIAAITCSLDHWLQACVDVAEKRIIAKTRSEDFVLQRVNLLGAETSALTTNNGFANIAGNRSDVTSIVINDIAQNLVERDITNASRWLSYVRSAGKQLRNKLLKPNSVVTVVGSEPTGELARVYNLSVDSCPEYFANGVLVHNCIRYALMTWPQLPKPPKADEKPLRDLSKLPQDYRMTIERMRKVDGIIANRKPEVATGLGDDFWGS